jgi:mannose/fructose-specific phosphotransferase system component IIA
LAKALVEAAESISGVTGVLLPVSNSGCDREALEARVEEAVDGRPAVVFVDLASGSCLFAVLKRLRAIPGVKVVTGVNLAMLVDFVFHASLTPEAAADRAIAAGTKAIRIP